MPKEPHCVSRTHRIQVYSLMQMGNGARIKLNEITDSGTDVTARTTSLRSKANVQLFEQLNQVPLLGRSSLMTKCPKTDASEQKAETLRHKLLLEEELRGIWMLESMKRP